MAKEKDYIRFDWAMKRLLRNKASFVVLEGFLSTLLEENIHIEELLESEANQQSADDKYNRVDLLAKDSKGEYIIIEVQNDRESHYFHRMLYGTSKVITDNIKLGERYNDVKKVYSINIIYFPLGTGEDYVYHGSTSFEGIHKHDQLQLTVKQKATFKVGEVKEIFPEYYILRVDNFDQIATSPLDEWISYLKTGDIPESADAQGLPEARIQWTVDSMSESDRKQYYRHLINVAIQMDTYETARDEGRDEGLKEGIKEGIREGIKEGIRETNLNNAKLMKEKGVASDIIAEVTGLLRVEIDTL